MDHTGFVYLNGRIIPASEAAVSPFDVGILRGYAVFDLLQTIAGRPFQLAEHLARFRSSAGLLGLEVPASDNEIATVIEELLSMNGHDEATVRLVLTGGESPDGMHFDPSTPTFFIITHEMFAVPARCFSDGARLLTVEHRREVPEAKTTNYVTWLRNHDRIEREDAIDVLFHSDGVVSEAATASFYIVRDGRIVAPSEGVLRGTVGTMVLERACADHPVTYERIMLEDVWSADEAFITSSVRGVVPIVRIDDRPIGDGRVGRVTLDLMRIWDEATNARA